MRMSVGGRTTGVRILTRPLPMMMALVACSGSAESGRRPLRPAIPPDLPQAERTALGASFVGHDVGPLGRLLHDSVIVQPPAPDSARQGAAAIRYLTNLAAHTAAAESRLRPSAVTPEGPFVFEQGTWVLRVGDRSRLGQYTLRWRRTPTGWKVVLWRWSTFR